MAAKTDRKVKGGPGISRIDQPERRTFGWFARVYFPGRTLSKFFPDLSHGGLKRALIAAQAYRDQILTAAEGKARLRLGSKYVTRMEYDRVKGWWVRVPDGKGKIVNRLFSDADHGGPAEARREAELWRDVLALHFGDGGPIRG